MAGWADIGGALAGNTAGNELSYQKGLALGANTQNAMQQARERVRQNTAMEQLPTLADELGIPAAYITAIQAGVDPTKITGTAAGIQEHGFRATAADPNVSPEAANIALRGVANAPVERYYAVGTGHADKFADTGVTANPKAPGGGAGGTAAAIQVLEAFGLVGPDGRIIPGKERQAFDVMRTTGRTVDEGGVPGVINFNPYAGGAAAPAAGPVADIGAAIAPPAPSMAPVVPAAAPAAAPVAPAAGVPVAAPTAQPVSTAQRVGANAAEIARQKEIGKAVGENQMAAPSALADIDKMTGNIGNFLQAPGFKGVYGNIQGQPGVKSVMGVLDQDVADAQGALANLDAQSFGISIQKMRGLGQLSNAEGLKVTQAFSRAVNPLLSEAEARKAWAEVLSGLQTARTRVLTGTLLPPDGSAPGAAAPPAAAGPTVYSDPAKEARYQQWKAAQGVK